MRNLMEKINTVVNVLSPIVNGFEALFIIAAPVYLFGWINGLLIASAMTSIFGTCQLLKRFVGMVEHDRREAHIMAEARRKKMENESKIIKPRN